GRRTRRSSGSGESGRRTGLVCPGRRFLQASFLGSSESVVRVVTRCRGMSPDRTAAHAHLAEVEAEQAALRRIAALLARSVPAEEVFDAAVDDVRSLMGVEAAGLLRYEADKTATVLAVSEERVVLPGDKLSTERHSV